MTLHKTLRYGDSELSLRIHENANIDEALDFLSSHFIVSTEPAASPLAMIDIKPLGHSSAYASHDAEPIYVRKSASDFFTITAVRHFSDGHEIVVCDKSGTVFDFESSSRKISVQVGPASQLDFVQLIRDIVLRDQECRGKVVLHSSAAFKNGNVVIIAGDKGAGKSTILLELVEHCGYQILSGDKVLVTLNSQGRPVASGWPDYPHLGYSTIRKYEGLSEIARLEKDYVPAPDHEFSPYGKTAVDPLSFRSRFPDAPVGTAAPVQAIFFPRIGPGVETEFKQINPGSEGEVLLALQGFQESMFSENRALWHHYFKSGPDLTTPSNSEIMLGLARMPVWTITGPGDVAIVPWEIQV